MYTDHSASLSKRHLSAMAGVFLSRCSGLLRTIIINALLGAGIHLDAFNAAFRFPNSLRDLFADGALSAAFIRTLVEVKRQGLVAERELIGIVLGFFITLTMILACFCVYFAPYLIEWISNVRFTADGGEALTVHLFQILIFYLPLTMLNAIIMAMLGVEGDTFRAMNGAIFLSIGMVGGVLVSMALNQIDAVWGLALGAMAGAFLQLLYQSWPFLRTKRLPLPCFNPWAWHRYQPLRQILWLMLPRTLGQGASTLALMVNTFFALQIGSGAMTYVATTMIIIQVPIGLFGVATGFAALPVLTETLQEGNLKGFSTLLIQSLETSGWLALFTSLSLSLFFLPFYIVLFQHGAIHFQDSLMNCIAISAFSTGIFFGACSKVLLNTLYAINATRLIVVNSFFYLLFSTVLSYLLTPRYALLGLGLAFGLSSAANFWLNYGFIYVVFLKNYGHSPYISGGKYHTFLYLLFSFIVIVAGIVGAYMLPHCWAHWLWIQGFFHALILSGIIAFSLLGLFIGLTLWQGPASLSRMLRKSLRLRM